MAGCRCPGAWAPGQRWGSLEIHVRAQQFRARRVAQLRAGRNARRLPQGVVRPLRDPVLDLRATSAVSSQGGPSSGMRGRAWPLMRRRSSLAAGFPGTTRARSSKARVEACEVSR
jgi:hypothetical protein